MQNVCKMRLTTGSCQGSGEQCGSGPVPRARRVPSMQGPPENRAQEGQSGQLTGRGDSRGADSLAGPSAAAAAWTPWHRAGRAVASGSHTPTLSLGDAALRMCRLSQQKDLADVIEVTYQETSEQWVVPDCRSEPRRPHRPPTGEAGRKVGEQQRSGPSRRWVRRGPEGRGL